MPKPENRGEYSPKLKLQAALSAFLIIAVSASPNTPEASSPAKTTLKERCQEEHPLSSPTSLVSTEGQGPALFDPASDFGSVIKKTVKEEIKAYLNSPERSARIARRVGGFASKMVEQANAGNVQYEFVPDGSTRSAPNKYQGFGTLYKNRDAPYIYGEGIAVTQAGTNNIYRYKDGTYYGHPEPSHLWVGYHEAEAEFWAPQGLGLGRCATVPDNGATQGWRVLYGEGGAVPLSKLQWEGSTYDYVDGVFNDGYESFAKIGKIDNHAFAMLQAGER